MFIRLQLLLVISVLAAATPVSAQGLEAGSYQTMSPSSSIGPDQDSLLPPEVVPLDPSTASNLSASQAQSRQSSMPGQSTGNVPGLVGQGSPAQAQQANPMDLRRQAFDQLYGNQTSLPPNAQNTIWRAGQKAAQTGLPQGVAPSMYPQSTPQMQPAQLGGPNYQMAGNQQTQQFQQGYIAQTQTLTGASQNQPQPVNTRRGGFSNGLSYGMTAALGGLGSGLMMNNPWLGAGIFGMTMTGFGVRNNTRF